MPTGYSTLCISSLPDERCRRCGSRILADRVAQIATLQILNAFSSWLFRVVKRECRSFERHVFGLDPLDETKVENWLATHTDTTLRPDLTRALESLPEHYRAIILLRDFEERTIREIAAASDLTVVATKSRLHRARLLLREYLLAK